MRLLILARPLMLTLFIFFFSVIAINAQTTAFTYQGKLTDNTSVGNGTYDLQFALYDALTGGNQVGTAQTHTGVMLNRGNFTVDLDFGSQFPGAERWLEISVKKPSDSSYTTLNPRQKINSVPYAARALSAATADSLSSACVGCVADSQINSVSGSKVTGTVANATNAATAATATTATTATTANTATNFSGSLAGDVTGTQSATTVSSIGGVSASNISSGATAANNATGANTAGAIVKRDASGNFSAGTITANLNGNATTATTATNATNAATASSVSSSAGDSVVTAINASNSAVNTAHVSGDVELLPTVTQTATQTTGTTRDLINTKLIGVDTLGTSGNSDLLSLSVSGTYRMFQDPNQVHTRDVERFRVDNSGGILAQGDLDIGTVMQEGSGVRFQFMPYKAAFRAGYVNGTQWDDANIGYYSVAMGNNARASGDNAFAAGQDAVAAGGNSTALGQFVTATGAASVALGYYAHTNSRQGSFVFSDRSIVSDGDIDTNEEDFKAQVNHSFNVRASGGYWLFTNSGETTGLRLSNFLPTGGTADNFYGSFVWTDRSSNNSITPTAQHQTIFRSSGGYWLYSDTGQSNGVTLAPGGGAWTTVSDRNMKDNFKAVNSREILRGVLALPISTWNYKTQDASIRHIGAMAQDFYSTFKVGEGDKTITTIDPDGVALAAIQGLNEELKDELKTRDAKIERLETQLKQQQTVLEAMKKLLCANNPNADVCK